MHQQTGQPHPHRRKPPPLTQLVSTAKKSRRCRATDSPSNPPSASSGILGPCNHAGNLPRTSTGRLARLPRRLRVHPYRGTLRRHTAPCRPATRSVAVSNAISPSRMTVARFKNEGNTCYVNSSLQALLAVSPFQQALSEFSRTVGLSGPVGGYDLPSFCSLLGGRSMNMGHRPANTRLQSAPQPRSSLLKQKSRGGTLLYVCAASSSPTL